jgi:hypothetical protein
VAKSDDLMSRLEAMNRGPLRNRPQPETEVAEVRRKLQKLRADARKPAAGEVRFRRDLPYSAPSPEPPRAPTGPPVDLVQAVQGVEVTSPCGGRAFVIERPVSERRCTPSSRGATPRSAGACARRPVPAASPPMTSSSWTSKPPG